MRPYHAKKALEIFLCTCGHIKLDHEWGFGPCDALNVDETAACSCQGFVPVDEVRYEEYIRIWADGGPIPFSPLTLRASSEQNK